MPNYDDIINIKRPISKKRKPMPIKKRSSQFKPFNALKGYQEKLNEINQKKIAPNKLSIIPESNLINNL